MTESQIIEGCQRNDAACQKLLFDRYHPQMLGLCRRYVRNREVAQDILQDGFIKVFKSIDAFEDKGSFEGWMKRIMVNTALEHIRKEARRGQEIDFENETLMMSIPAEALNQLSSQDIHRFIEALPQGYRIIFNLFAIEGFSHQEIAAQLNISVNTSYSQYHRARGLLQKMLMNDKSRIA